MNSKAVTQERDRRRTLCSPGVRHLRLPAVKSDMHDPSHRMHGRTEIEAIRSLQEAHADVGFPTTVLNPDDEIA